IKKTFPRNSKLINFNLGFFLSKIYLKIKRTKPERNFEKISIICQSKIGISIICLDDTYYHRQRKKGKALSTFTNFTCNYVCINTPYLLIYKSK
ncbi:MAG TPA: hypothetical protein DCM10_03935, partial [Xanthomarina gelatinilytica]|nr:hypothetical protein [Xanthomarina gelatinilytica]